MGFLDSLLGLNQGKPLIDAANQNKSVIDQYGTTANNLIDTGATQAGGYLGKANDLANLGLNAVGTTYQQSPGYQFALDQGTQQINRGAASRGMLGSGNTSADLIDYATGAANKDYNSWLGNLNAAIGTGIGTNDNLANLATGTATAKTGIAGDVASGTMGANNQVAKGQQQNDAGLSNLLGTIVGTAGKFIGYGGF